MKMFSLILYIIVSHFIRISRCRKQISGRLSMRDMGKLFPLHTALRLMRFSRGLLDLCSYLFVLNSTLCAQREYYYGTNECQWALLAFAFFSLCQMLCCCLYFCLAYGVSLLSICGIEWQNANEWHTIKRQNYIIKSINWSEMKLKN